MSTLRNHSITLNLGGLPFAHWLWEDAAMHWANMFFWSFFSKKRTRDWMKLSLFVIALSVFARSKILSHRNAKAQRFSYLLSASAALRLCERLKISLFSIPVLFLITTLNAQPSTINIQEKNYENRPHYIINTPAAIYYYDQAGGGLSRMLDIEGNDWINFQMEPWNQYPASAASAYRGIPNFVFGSDDSGAGHPGHNVCISEVLDATSILTTSKSGKWQWKWTFFKDHATVEMLKTDPDHPYWFLYEGTPGGKFEPSKQYWGTDTEKINKEQLDYYAGNKRFEQWRWAYFGHEEANRVLLIVQKSPDQHSDTFSYLGNTTSGISSSDGMVVFGFGRAEGAKPLMKGKNTFVISFVEGKSSKKKLYKRLKRRAKSFY